MNLPELLPSELVRNSDAAPIFRSLKYRNFSFTFVEDPAFRIPFPKRVGLRFALLLPKRMQLSTAVNRALRHERCKHVTSCSGRCAAFALGMSRKEHGAVVWYLLTLQSDLAFSPRAALRDYLRGWRKVLFGCIKAYATSRSIDVIRLSPAGEVFRAAVFRNRSVPGRIPPVWEAIYDGTAREFGMVRTEIEDPLNIQVLPRRRPCFSKEFFELRLKGTQPMKEKR